MKYHEYFSIPFCIADSQQRVKMTTEDNVTLFLLSEAHSIMPLHSAGQCR